MQVIQIKQCHPQMITDINQMSMSMMIVAVLGLVEQTLGLGLREAHQMPQMSHELFGFNSYSMMQDFQVIGIFVVIIGVGVCCFYFRGCFGNRSGDDNTVVVQNSSGQADPIIPARQDREYYQAPKEEPVNKNTVLEYFSSQKAPIPEKYQPQVIKDSSSPYITAKSADTLAKWDPIKDGSITSCAVCNLFNKSNSIPIVQVECLEDHCFHVSCISQHRSKQVVERAGNGLNKCPKCKENYSPVIRIYCPTCKNNSISINLVTFSNQSGKIDTDEIVKKYGASCQTCRHG